MTIVKDAVNAYIKASRKDWDRTATVGSSEIGQCARKVWFAKAEETELASTFARNPDYVDSWGARERGNIVENNLFVPAIKQQYGRKAKLLGKNQLTFTDGLISATPDCLILAKPQFMIECKSIDPRVKLDEPKPEHVYQVQVQMGVLRALKEAKPQYAILVYFNASFVDEITEFRIDYDPDIYERAKVRATKIMTASSRYELQPEGWIAGGKECEYCPFTDACGRARKEVPTEVIEPADLQFIAEISDMAREYKNLEGTIAACEENRRDLQNEIKERLREKGQSKIIGDGVTISWTPVSGRESFDNAAIREVLAKQGRDMDEFKREGQPGDRLTVTLKPKTMADKAKVA